MTDKQMKITLNYYKQLAYEAGVVVQSLKTENAELWDKITKLQSANGALIDKLQAIEDYVAELEGAMPALQKFSAGINQ